MADSSEEYIREIHLLADSALGLCVVDLEGYSHHVGSLKHPFPGLQPPTNQKVQSMLQVHIRCQ